MQKVIKLYCDNIIKPIENERDRLLTKIYSRNIFDILLRSFYQEYLEKIESILFGKYRKLEEIIRAEIEFDKR